MPGKVAQVVWNLKLIGYRQKCPKVADFSYFGIIPMNDSYDLKVCLNRYSWGAGKVGSEYSSWFIRLECIRLKMEAGDCPTLNMNAKENYLLSQSLKQILSIHMECTCHDMVILV